MLLNILLVAVLVIQVVNWRLGREIDRLRAKTAKVIETRHRWELENGAVFTALNCADVVCPDCATKLRAAANERGEALISEREVAS